MGFLWGSCPLITRVINHLLSGVSHQVVSFLVIQLASSEDSFPKNKPYQSIDFSLKSIYKSRICSLFLNNPLIFQIHHESHESQSTLRSSSIFSHISVMEFPWRKSPENHATAPKVDHLGPMDRAGGPAEGPEGPGHGSECWTTDNG